MADPEAPLSEALRQVYERLLAQHGPQHWWPAETPFEVIVGAILTQNMAWANVERALDNLKAAGVMDAKGLRALSVERLAELIRPAGYYNAKARKLHAFVDYLASYGDDLGAALSGPRDEKKKELLALHGVGEETADALLLYVGRVPSFVIDAYTRRIVTRLGLASEKESYRDLQRLFEENLPREEPLFNEFHALLDQHAKEVCTKRDPRCGACSLLDLCPTGQQRVG